MHLSVYYRYGKLWVNCGKLRTTHWLISPLQPVVQSSLMLIMLLYPVLFWQTAVRVNIKLASSDSTRARRDLLADAPASSGSQTRRHRFRWRTRTLLRVNPLATMLERQHFAWSALLNSITSGWPINARQLPPARSAKSTWKLCKRRSMNVQLFVHVRKLQWSLQLVSFSLSLSFSL